MHEPGFFGLPRTPADALLLRARSRRRRGFAGEAFVLYERAVKLQTGVPAAIVAEEWLDHCLASFGDASPEALTAAAALGACDPAGPGEARHHLLLGLRASQAARRLPAPKAAPTRETLAAALAKAEEARASLLRAVDLDPDNRDARGTLGGVLSRMADWARAAGDDRAANYRQAAMNAYAAGAAGHPDPYCFLNLLVERVVARSEGAGAADDPPFELLPKEHELAMDAVIRLRRNQLRDRVDRPWAAFDLALAQWLAKPDPAALVADLGAAVLDARDAARTPADSWMVSTALRTYERLDRATAAVCQPRAPGLMLAIGYLENQLSEERWFAAELPRIARPEDLIAGQFDSLKRELSGRNAELAHRIDSMRGSLEERWSQEDEAAFEQWIGENRKLWEAPERKWARVVWKLASTAGGTVGEKIGEDVVEALNLGSLLGD